MSKSKPHPVDVHVGRRLKSRRTILGMSQDDLGNAVNITFQQIQKYERGYNRIGSSRLYEFSCILNVSVAYFFEEYESGDGIEAVNALPRAANADLNSLESNKEVLALIRSYYGIKNENVRRRILGLVRALSAAEGSDISLEDEVTQDAALSSSATIGA